MPEDEVKEVSRDVVVKSLRSWGADLEKTWNWV